MKARKSMYHHSFKSWISIRASEEFVIDIAEKVPACKEVQLDFSNSKALDPGVGWRIGNSLSHFRDLQRASLTVMVPSVGESVRFNSEQWFNVFIRSGLGMSIARYAIRILSDGHDVTEDFKEYFSRVLFKSTTAIANRQYVPEPYYQSLMEYGRDTQIAQNSVMIRSLSGSHMNLSNPAVFYENHMLPYWRHVNATSDAWLSQDIASIAEISVEACKNVGEHAVRSLDGRSISVLSYFSMRYYKAVSASHLAAGDLKIYLDRLASQPERFGHDVSFIEVTVNDDGVGIPVRQSGERSIYSENIEFEWTSLLAALTAGKSAKSTQVDVPVVTARGYGYLRILKGLRGLNAYAMLRTGRSAAFCDGTQGDETHFKVVNQVLGVMPGTSLNVLIPIPRPQQQTSLPL